MHKNVVTIIGMGPRGLSIFERIVSISRSRLYSMPIEIHLVDPKECGQGVHNSRQPNYLLTNTLASQVTLFPGDNVSVFNSSNPGPSFTEWARSAGYRRFENAYYKVNQNVGEEIGEHDYLPRSLLGEYSTWVYNQTIAALPITIQVYHHRKFAINMQHTCNGQYIVQLDNNFIITSDYVFITTGHGKRISNEEDNCFDEFVQSNSRRNSKLAYFNGAYPVDNLLKVNSDAVVAVQGLGLTAHDVVAELTVGRGGKFTSEGNYLKYNKSGDEPRIIVFSRNCLPFAARGINKKGINGQRKAIFFTKDAVKKLRDKASSINGNKQLDFEKEILPLLLKEMGYVYHTTKYKEKIEPDNYQIGEEENLVIKKLFYPVSDKLFDSPAAFRNFFMNHMMVDLDHANQGNISSPVKAATDVIREVRESLRAAVEHGGLTPDSHRKFIHEYAPIMNRISFGPPRVRNFEWLALLNTGILNVANAPNPKINIDKKMSKFVLESQFHYGIERQFFDVLIIAKLDAFYPETDSSILIHNLLHSGLIRPYYNSSFHPGGIDIDECNHPITRDGILLNNVWAVGYLVEGPHFYTHALPRPFMSSRQTQDAEKCVIEMFDNISIKQAKSSVDIA